MISTIITSLFLLSTLGSIFIGISCFRLPSSLQKHDRILCIIPHMSLANALMQIMTLFSPRTSLVSQLSSPTVPLSYVQKILLRYPLCSTRNGIRSYALQSYLFFNAVITISLRQKLASIIKRKNDSTSHTDLFNTSQPKSSLGGNFVFHPSYKSPNVYKYPDKTKMYIFLSWFVPILLIFGIPSIFPLSFWTLETQRDANMEQNSIEITCDYIQTLYENAQLGEENQDENSFSSLNVSGRISFIISFILLSIPLLSVCFCTFILWRSSKMLYPTKKKFLDSRTFQYPKNKTNNQYHYDIIPSYQDDTSIHSIYSSAPEAATLRHRSDQQESILKPNPGYNTFLFSNKFMMEDEQGSPEMNEYQHLFHQYGLFPVVLISYWIIQGILILYSVNYASFSTSLMGMIELGLFSPFPFHNMNWIMVMTGISNCIVWILRGPNVVARWNKDYWEVDPYQEEDIFVSHDREHADLLI